MRKIDLVKSELSEERQTHKERLSNFELLRIIAMVLIVMHHFSVHGEYSFEDTGITVNRIWVQILSAGGRLGVDTFILISGYFLVTSQYKPRKLLTLILQVTEYAVFCTLLVVFTGGIQISTVAEAVAVIKKAILPIPYGEYWFATTYILLYMFSPYLNLLIKHMEKKMHLKLIATGIIVWCVFPTFMNASFGFSYAVWFVILYFIASYLRYYPLHFKNLKRNSWIIAVGSYVLLTLLIVGLDIASIKVPMAGGLIARAREMNSVLILICAVSTFLAFHSLKIQNKFINAIAATTFGIYLLHDNPIMRNTLWVKLFKGNSHIENSYFILYSLLVIGIVFCVGVTVEMLRLKLSKCVESCFMTKNIKETQIK